MFDDGTFIDPIFRADGTLITSRAYEVSARTSRRKPDGPLLNFVRAIPPPALIGDAIYLSNVAVPQLTAAGEA